jgi:hypothetical protein
MDYPRWPRQRTGQFLKRSRLPKTKEPLRRKCFKDAKLCRQDSAGVFVIGNEMPLAWMTKSSIEGFFAWQIGILARMMDIQSAGRLELGTAIGITN